MAFSQVRPTTVHLFFTSTSRALFALWICSCEMRSMPTCGGPRNARAVFTLDRYQSGIDHSLIDLGSGMVNWYLRIPLSSLILLSSDGAVFSRDPCIGLLQCSGKRKNMAGNGRKQPEKVGYGKKRDGI